MDMLMEVFVLMLLSRHGLTPFLLGTLQSIANFHRIGLPTLTGFAGYNKYFRDFSGPASHPLGLSE
jgi:hypothetical protein